MINKPERYENELAIHAARGDAGSRAVHTWLCARRDELNAKWVGASGDDLTKMQGEAGMVARLIKLIEHGPSVK